MSHEITQRADGMSEFAFVGARSAVWHGLGQELTADAPLEVWKKQAGMDWEALASKVSYDALVGTKVERLQVPDTKLLFRSDTQAPLGIVSDNYKVVQPGEVLEFFDDLTKLHGMRLSTAGTLFGGKRFWGLAETNQKGDVVDGDEVGGYLLLTTSVDGTMSTQARFTSTRVVCNNTLTIALSGKSKNAVKITHKKEFDPKQVKIDLGLLNQSWSDYMDSLKRLSSVKMDEAATRKFYEKMFYDPKKLVEEQSLSATRTVSMLMERAFNGVGSDMSRGTAWGALNGATELFTHWKGNRDQSIQFWDSYAGEMSNQKSAIYDTLLTLDRREELV